jgi:hypothetical protein
MTHRRMKLPFWESAAHRGAVGILAVGALLVLPAPANAATACGAFGENGTLEAAGVSCGKARSVMRYAEAHRHRNTPRGPKGWSCTRGYPNAPSMASGFTCRRSGARIVVRYRSEVCIKGAFGDCLVRPKKLNVTVSDLQVDRLRWRSWGGKTATGTGRYRLRTMGTDEVTTGRATITASAPEECDGELRYSQYTVRMRGQTHRFGSC